MDDFRYHWTLDKIARYETRLENSMIRCLNRFQKVRESKMMNFTGLRQYCRDFQPRPKDFMEENAPKKTSTQSDSGCHSREGGNPDFSSETAQIENTQNPAQIINHQSTNKRSNLDLQIKLSRNRSLDTGDSESLPIDSFTKWRELYCEPRGYHHNYDDSGIIPEVLHRPDVPQVGEYSYRENWQHRMLDMLNYPWEKRRNLTKPELTELVDPILRTMPDPHQFLWDFGLIELTADAVAKRYPKTNAG
jgi:hypothetical protein